MSNLVMRTALLLLALGLAIAPSVAMAGLVSDGSFEAATTGIYTGAIGDGWTVDSGTIQIFGPGDGFGVAAHSGVHSADLDYGLSLNTLSQSISTVPGQDYLVSFYLAGDAANPVTVTFGGQTIFSGMGPSNGLGSSSDYVLYSGTVTASSTSTPLSFTGQYTSNSTGGAIGTVLDDVSVASVPEPSTLLMAGLGLLGLLGYTRRYRKSA